MAGSERATATIPGRRSVTSLRLRVKMRTSSPARCTCTRAPSSFHSTDDRPHAPIASATDTAVAASIGSTGRSTSSPTSLRAASPPACARQATTRRSPLSIAARRTDAIGTPTPRATASVTIPSSAPWRRSPSSSRRRNHASVSVARESSAVNRSTRRALEPGPAVTASSASTASTSRTVSEGDGAGGGSTARTVAHPTPSRPWRVSPLRKATPASISDGSSRPITSARTLTLVERARVAATCSDAPTRSASSVTGR